MQNVPAPSEAEMRGSSLAKISRPIVKKAFPRKRLFSQLDRMRQNPIVWVSGVAGCGKTTLVSTYIDDRCLPCLWYQIDEGDQDIATFFYYMGLAVKKASGKRRPLPLMTAEYLQDIPTFARRFFENAFSQLKPSTIIVLDNYQLIPEECGFHEVFLHGLSAIPKGLQVILISRTAPSSALVRLQANRIMEHLGWDQLRLTLAESLGISRLTAPKSLSKKTIEHLHVVADGWAAGLILMLESLKRGIDPNLLGKMPAEEIMGYFGSELFARIDNEEREFLLKTAFMPKITPKMAESLTGISQASSILSRLSRNNNFTHKRDHPEPLYEYHPLLREFLMSRAKEIFSPEVISNLIRRSATLLEEAGETESAAELYSEIKDWGALSRLVLKQAAELVVQGRSGTLEEWLNRFPKEMMESVPWLVYWKGVCRLPYSPAEARSDFEEAFHLFEAGEDEAGTYLAWSGVLDCIFYEMDDFTRLDRWIDWLDKKMERYPSFPSIDIEGRVTSNMAGALAWRKPYRTDIEEWLTRALRASEKTGDFSWIQTAFLGMCHYLWVGKPTKARMMMEETRRMALSSATTPLTLVTWKCLEALYHNALLTDSHLELPSVLEALEIAKKSGIHVMDHLLFAYGVYAALSLGDLTRAEGFLREMEASFGQGQRSIASHYHFLCGWCDLLRGRTSEANAHAETSLKLALETGVLIGETLTRLLVSRVQHRSGEYKEALAQLSSAEGLIESSGCQSFKYQLLVSEAQFAMERGEEEKCIDALRRGLAFGNNIGLKHIMFLWQRSEMARLCAKALENDIEVEYVRDLIRLFDLTPDNISPDLGNWPWPLKIHTLGQFELQGDDKAIKFSGKVQKKPLLLLKAVIALGGRNVKEDDVADLLWPDADGDNAHASFTTTLSRLRRLIGHEKALQLKEGRLELDGRYCWVDIWAFEHLISQADASWQKGETENALGTADKAMSIYKGHFLADETEEPWMASARERLRNKFLRNVSKVGHHYQQAGEWEKALGCYYRGLEVDDLEEEIYQYIMLCCCRLGRKAEGVRAYKRCRDALSAGLGVEPSSETEALYKTLRFGNR
jgi:LuxR family maltose regulon positive regulatory protein